MCSTRERLSNEEEVGERVEKYAKDVHARKGFAEVTTEDVKKKKPVWIDRRIQPGDVLQDA